MRALPPSPADRRPRRALRLWAGRVALLAGGYLTVRLLAPAGPAGVLVGAPAAALALAAEIAWTARLTRSTFSRVAARRLQALDRLLGDGTAGAARPGPRRDPGASFLNPWPASSDAGADVALDGELIAEQAAGEGRDPGAGVRARLEPGHGTRATPFGDQRDGP